MPYEPINHADATPPDTAALSHHHDHDDEACTPAQLRWELRSLLFGIAIMAERLSEAALVLATETDPTAPRVREAMRVIAGEAADLIAARRAYDALVACLPEREDAYDEGQDPLTAPPPARASVYGEVAR